VTVPPGVISPVATPGFTTEQGAALADDKNEHVKTHHECKCRDCDPVVSMAERVDAYLSAMSLLSKGNWAEDDKPTVRDTVVLANWLYYGQDADDD
jgi:hypothetical protein